MKPTGDINIYLLKKYTLTLDQFPPCINLNCT